MRNMNEFCGNRKVAVSALTGSHNYNLNTAGSDKDYKYFVFPTFEDLYHSKMFSNSMTSPEMDATCHDVRQLVDLVWKANINFVEVLYSTELEVHPALEFMFNMRDEFATMNLYTFFKATYGMHLMKLKDLHKGTETTTHLVEKFGYDTKQACHALRCLYTISRYMNMGDMGEALWFKESDLERDVLLAVKNGKYTEQEFMQKVIEWYLVWKNHAENFYKEQLPRKEFYEYAQGLLLEAVRTNLTP